MNPSDPEHKMLLGQFELVEELGSGASGTVYRARIVRPIHDLAVGTEVAIKFLRQDRTHDARAAARLVREGQLGRRVRSPYVAEIWAVETIEVLGLSTTYLVMELVEGRDLRQFLRDTGGAVEDLVRRIGHDAALGLAALHRLGIVHRDVKPENLALTAGGQVKLMDLGLAREIADRPGTGFSGSLAYAAPEVLRGQPATPQSDLYGLGLVLFELVTGRHPFAEHVAAADDVLHAHLELAPPRPSHFRPRLSALLETVILELLAKDPAARPRSARALAAALDRGENSRYWLEHERRAPALASRRRLQELRRFAPVAFVGRRSEERALDRWLRQARTRRGVAVRVCGPHGVGRRRMLDECIARWIDDFDDLVFLGGEPDAGPSRLLGSPFPRLVAEWFLRGDDADSPHAAERLTSRLLESRVFEPNDAQRLALLATGGDPGTSAAVRADLLVRALSQVAADDRTLVLRIDRADTLDTTGRHVVDRLLETIDDRRLLLLLVGGVQWVDEPFAGEKLALRGLEPDDFATYAGGLFAPGQAPTELLEQAARTLAGNPGFLLESLEDLRQRGVLAGRAGSYRVTGPLREIPPPGPVLLRLRARVAELEPAPRHVLQAAAILGVRFAVGDLAALTGHNELYVLETLSVFQGHLLRVEHNEGRFRHREYRRALLDTMPVGTRQRLHRMAAWVLEERGAAPLEIGLHLSRAREHEASLEPLLAGLERLVAAGTRKVSRRVAERLRLHLGALPRTPLNLMRRLRWLLLAGRAHAQADRFERARGSFTKAYRLAVHLDDTRARAEALLGLANLARAHTHLLSALQLLERARLALAGADEPAAMTLAARVLGVHARVLGDLGDADGALARTTEALTLLPPDEARTRPHLLIDAARLEALLGRFVAASARLDRAAELVRGEGEPVVRLRLGLCRGWVLTLTGDLDGAARDLEAARAGAHALADRRREARAQLWLGDVARWQDDGDAAQVSYKAAERCAVEHGDRLTAARAALRLGRVDAALAEEVQALDVPALTADWCLLEAAVAVGRGDRTAADAALARARDIEANAILALPLRLRVLHATGQQERARRWTQGLARQFGGAARRRFMAHARRLLG